MKNSIILYPGPTIKSKSVIFRIIFPTGREKIDFFLIMRSFLIMRWENSFYSSKNCTRGTGRKLFGTWTGYRPQGFTVKFSFSRLKKKLSKNPKPPETKVKSCYPPISFFRYMRISSLQFDLTLSYILILCVLLAKQENKQEKWIIYIYLHILILSQFNSFFYSVWLRKLFKQQQQQQQK